MTRLFCWVCCKLWCYSLAALLFSSWSTAPTACCGALLFSLFLLVCIKQNCFDWFPPFPLCFPLLFAHFDRVLCFFFSASTTTIVETLRYPQNAVVFSVSTYWMSNTARALASILLAVESEDETMWSPRMWTVDVSCALLGWPQVVSHVFLFRTVSPFFQICCHCCWWPLFSPPVELRRSDF